MLKIIEWTKSRLDQIYILCLGRSSQYAEGLLICCYSDGVTAARGLLGGHVLQYGYKYSQTCIYKENIKICTVANFQCVLGCRKTPIWSVQKFVCQKIRKKTFLGNSTSKAHLKYQDTFALLDTYPEQMENKTMKVYAKDSAVFYGKSQAPAGCQLN